MSIISSRFLADDIEVFRATRTSDGAGRFTNFFSKVGPTYRGGISGVSSSTRDRGGREERSYTDVLYLNPGANIQRNDKIRRKSDGLEAVVTHVRTLSTPNHMEVEIRRT